MAMAGLGWATMSDVAVPEETTSACPDLDRYDRWLHSPNGVAYVMRRDLKARDARRRLRRDLFAIGGLPLLMIAALVSSLAWPEHAFLLNALMLGLGVVALVLLYMRRP